MTPFFFNESFTKLCLESLKLTCFIGNKKTLEKGILERTLQVTLEDLSSDLEIIKNKLNDIREAAIRA